MTLTEFLLARIAEDVAQASGVGDVHTYAFIGDRPGVVLSGDRWRAECEAKRLILDDFQTWTERAQGGDALATATALGLRVACLRLAAVYSDHPDHREEWKP